MQNMMSNRRWACCVSVLSLFIIKVLVNGDCYCCWSPPPQQHQQPKDPLKQKHHGIMDGCVFMIMNIKISCPVWMQTVRAHNVAHLNFINKWMCTGNQWNGIIHIHRNCLLSLIICSKVVAFGGSLGGTADRIKVMWDHGSKITFTLHKFTCFTIHQKWSNKRGSDQTGVHLWLHMYWFTQWVKIQWPF